MITKDHPDPETTDNGNPDDPCPSGDCNGSDNGSPDDPCPSGDYNDCYGNGGGGGSAPPPAPTEPPCTITSCLIPGYVVVNCECVCPKKTTAFIADKVYDTLNGSQEFGKPQINSPNISIVDPDRSDMP